MRTHDGVEMPQYSYHSYLDEHAPFVRHDSYGAMGLERQGLRERTRLRIASLTLMPLRFFVGMSLVALYYVVCLLFPKNERLNRAALSFVSRSILLVIGFGFGSIQVDSPEGLARCVDASAAVVSNHTSWADILILCWLFAPSFVARSATRETPLIGRVSQAMRCLYVEREKTNGKGGIASQLQERMHMTSRAKARPIAIFAEGTTTNGTYLLPFKSGAFLALLPVTLVVIKYAKGGRVSPAWESISGLRHVVLMLSEPRHRASVTVATFVPNPGESPQDYCRRARQTMLETGGLLDSESTFRDKLNYHKLLRQQHDKFE